MERIGIDADADTILEAVDRWADLLAAGDYTRAFEYVLCLPWDGWTPELMHACVRGYGYPEPLPDGRVMEVTPRATAEAMDIAPYREVTWWHPPKAAPARANIRGIETFPGWRGAKESFLGEVWYSLPLNGQWSDLVAELDIVVYEGALVLALRSIRVP